LPVRKRSKILGSLRVTNSPSLEAGPGGKGVAVGVGVGAGVGVSVGSGGLVAVAVAVAVAAVVGLASGLSGSVGVASGDEGTVGVLVGVPVAAMFRGVRVGVAVGSAGRGMHAAPTTVAPRPAMVRKKTRRLNLPRAGFSELAFFIRNLGETPSGRRSKSIGGVANGLKRGS
jgi:hypothetical protein